MNKPNVLFLANSLYGGGVQEFIFNITKKISVVQPIILAPKELYQESFDRNTHVKVERETINNYNLFDRLLYKLAYITSFQSIYRSLQYKPFIKDLLALSLDLVVDSILRVLYTLKRRLRNMGCFVVCGCH